MTEKNATDAASAYAEAKRPTPTSTVGRGKTVKIDHIPAIDVWRDEYLTIQLGDSLTRYGSWPSPTVIVSDGGYGILGFEGDTSDHLDLPGWYEPHVKAWADAATPKTTLWFWNSEIGWAAVHPVLERHGWRYVNCNIWDKGKAHIAGNVNTKKIRRFPVVSEVCAHYVFEPRMDGLVLKHWLLREWKRTGLPVRDANKACGVMDAAVRKYLDQGHLWYWPPVEMFERLVAYANQHGKPEGRPYFSKDGTHPMTGVEWAAMRPTFNCPHGFTNVWNRSALRNKERVKTNGSSGKAVHLNQKPLDLMRLIIEASSQPGDIVWEPFGGMFSASLAARLLERKSYSAEIDPAYFHYGLKRVIEEVDQLQLP